MLPHRGQSDKFNQKMKCVLHPLSKDLYLIRSWKPCVQMELILDGIETIESTTNSLSMGQRQNCHLMLSTCYHFLLGKTLPWAQIVTRLSTVIGAAQCNFCFGLDFFSLQRENTRGIKDLITVHVTLRSTRSALSKVTVTLICNLRGHPAVLFLF